MPEGLEGKDLEKLTSELTKYAEEGATDEEMRQFRESFTSELKKKASSATASSATSTEPATPIADGIKPDIDFGYKSVLEAANAATSPEKIDTGDTTNKTDATDVADQSLPVIPKGNKLKEVKTVKDFNEKYGTNHTLWEMLHGKEEWAHLHPELHTDETHEKKAEAENDFNSVKEYAKSAAAGLDKTYAMLLGMPNMLYNTLAIPVNAAANAVGIEGETHADENGILNKSADFYRQRSEETLKTQQQHFDKTLFDEFNEGDKGKAMDLLANSIIQMMPAMGAMMATVAAGASSAAVETGAALAFGSEKYNEIKDLPLPESTKVANALSTGALMSMFNKWSFDKMAIPVAKAFQTGGREAAEKVAKETFEETYKKVFQKLTPITDPIHSGLAFAATTFATNAVDVVSGVAPDKKLGEGVVDTFIEGMGIGALTHGTSRILNRGRKEKIGQLLTEAQQVKKDSDNPQVNLEAKEALLATFTDKVEQANGEIEKDRKNAVKYTPEEIQQVADLSELIERNKKVIDDANISGETKKLAIEKNEKLNEEIDKVNEAVEKRTTKDVDNIIEQQQKRLGLPTQPEVLLPARAEEIMKRVEQSGSANVDNIDFLAHQLYQKYQAIEAIKTQPGRRFTIKQIDGVLSDLNNKITLLDEASRKHKEEGKQKIKIDVENFSGKEQRITIPTGPSSKEVEEKADLHNSAPSSAPGDQGSEVQETGVVQDGVVNEDIKVSTPESKIAQDTNLLSDDKVKQDEGNPAYLLDEAAAKLTLDRFKADLGKAFGVEQEQAEKIIGLSKDNTPEQNNAIADNFYSDAKKRYNERQKAETKASKRAYEKTKAEIAVANIEAQALEADAKTRNKINAMTEFSTQKEAQRKEIEKQLSERGIHFQYSGTSETNGLSIYYKVGDKKLRFSNHSTSKTDRVLNELHFSLPFVKRFGVQGKTTNEYNSNSRSFDLYKDEIASNGNTKTDGKQTKEAHQAEETGLLEKDAAAGEEKTPAVKRLKEQLGEAKTEAKKREIRGKIIETQIPEHDSRETKDIEVTDNVTASVENIEMLDGDEGYKITVKDADGKELDSRNFYEKEEVAKFLSEKQKGYSLSATEKKAKTPKETKGFEVGAEVSYMDNAGVLGKGKVESVSGDQVEIKNEKGVIYTRKVEDLQRAQTADGLPAAKAAIEKAVLPPKEPTHEEVKKQVKASILPVKEGLQAIFKGANYLQDKTAKFVDNGETWLADKVKQANVSQNAALRTIGQMTTSYTNGLPRTSKEVADKRLLTGGIKLAQDMMGRNIEALRTLIDHDLLSMERVHEVLDPEFYNDEQGQPTKQITKMADLNPAEKKLAETLRSMLDYVHDYNFAMGMIDAETYNKHKGEYTPRLYESFEIPEDVQVAIDEHATYAGKKLITDIFSKRKEVTEEMRKTILKDPIYATAKRMMQTEVNASILSYLGNVAKDSRLVSDTEQKGFNKLEGKGYGPLNGKYVANYIAEDLKGYHFANQALDHIYNAVKIYDTTAWRQFFKKMHTVWDPAVQAGNFTANFVFSFMGGLDPVTYAGNLGKAAKEIKTKGATYDLLLKNGIIGTNVLSADLLPFTPEIQAAKAVQPNILRKTLGKVDDFTMKLYEGTDNNAKVAAYMGFREYGYSEQDAIQRVYDSFQNYATVGKIWDAASKTPIWGNAYVKFQADLQRILKNAALKRPLTTAMYAGMIYTIAQMTSKMAGEDEKQKALREGREFIPKIDLGFAQIPLTFKTPAGEVNLARYLSPYYLYDMGDNASPIESWSKMLPYKVKYNEGPAKGVFAWLPSATTDDPMLGVWVAALATDRDFRGKSIKDPLATRYRVSGLTETEKALNSINYVLRSQLPFFDSAEDMYLATTEGSDFYGRQKDGLQALISKFVKTQSFGPAQYNEIISKKIIGFKFQKEALEQEAKDIQTTIRKKVDKSADLLQQKAITQKQFDKIEDDAVNDLVKRKTEVFIKMANVQKQFNEYIEKYRDLFPTK